MKIQSIIAVVAVCASSVAFADTMAPKMDKMEKPKMEKKTMEDKMAKPEPKMEKAMAPKMDKMEKPKMDNKM
jgi:short subunit fatty acids transporter